MRRGTRSGPFTGKRYLAPGFSRHTGTLTQSSKDRIRRLLYITHLRIHIILFRQFVIRNVNTKKMGNPICDVNFRLYHQYCGVSLGFRIGFAVYIAGSFIRHCEITSKCTSSVIQPWKFNSIKNISNTKFNQGVEHLSKQRKQNRIKYNHSYQQ